MGTCSSEDGRRTQSSETQEEEENKYLVENYHHDKAFRTETLSPVPTFDMQQRLNKHIGALISTDSQGLLRQGTAVLISPNLVLTSAHNVFDP